MCSVGTKEEECNDNFTLFSFSSQLGEILRSHVDKRNWWNSSMSNISDLENWKRLVLVNYFCISNIHSHCRNGRNDIQVLLPAILLSFLETAKRSTAACVCVCVCVSARMHACPVVSDSATPGTVAYQVLLSMQFSRQEYWSGLPFPTPQDLPGDQTPLSCISCVDSQILYHCASWEAIYVYTSIYNI